MKEHEFRGMTIWQYIIWKLFETYPPGYSACTYCGGAEEHRNCIFEEEK